MSGVSRHGTSSCRGRTLIIGLYFAFWVLYSVAVTFTAVSALLAALTGGTAGHLSSAAVTVRSVAGSVGAGAAAAMDRYSAGESRRLQDAVSDSQRACSRAYMDELFAGVTGEIERAIRSAESQSVSRTVRERTERLLEAFRHQLDSHSAIYHDNLTAAMAGEITDQICIRQLYSPYEWQKKKQKKLNLNFKKTCTDNVIIFVYIMLLVCYMHYFQAFCGADRDKRTVFVSVCTTKCLKISYGRFGNHINAEITGSQESRAVTSSVESAESVESVESALIYYTTSLH